MSLISSLDATPFEGLEVAYLHWRYMTFFGLATNSLGDRMFRGCLDCCGYCQRLIFCPTFNNRYVNHTKAAFGQRARLVENYRINQACFFQCQAISNKNAIACAK